MLNGLDLVFLLERGQRLHAEAERQRLLNAVQQPDRPRLAVLKRLLHRLRPQPAGKLAPGELQ